MSKAPPEIKRSSIKVVMGLMGSDVAKKERDRMQQWFIRLYEVRDIGKFIKE